MLPDSISYTASSHHYWKLNFQTEVRHLSYANIVIISETSFSLGHRIFKTLIFVFAWAPCSSEGPIAVF